MHPSSEDAAFIRQPPLAFGAATAEEPVRGPGFSPPAPEVLDDDVLPPPPAPPAPRVGAGRHAGEPASVPHVHPLGQALQSVCVHRNRSPSGKQDKLASHCVALEQSSPSFALWSSGFVTHAGSGSPALAL